MFEALLALGLLFWFGAAAVVIAVCIFLEYDFYFWPFLLLILAAVGFEVLYEPSILNAFEGVTLRETVTNVLLFGGKYLGAGIVWCLPKWFFKMKNHKEDVKDVRDRFIRENGVITAENQHKLKQALNSKSLLTGGHRFIADEPHRDKSPISVTLRARDSWRQIGSWIVYWPFSFLNTVFKDLVKWMYYLVRDLLDLLSERYFRAMNEELNVVK